MLRPRERRPWGWLVAVGLLNVLISGCFQNRSLRRSADGTLARARAGVFGSAADYEQGRLASPVECVSATRPIARDAFTKGQVLELDASGPTPATQYRKPDVFGFRACDGSDVRLVGGERYRIERATPLYLYERERRVRVRRGSLLVRDYFFSMAAGDSVRPLTLLALKRAYPSNHRFHDLLDLAFRSDDELMHYDDFHHEYRVAHLLRTTLP